MPSTSGKAIEPLQPEDDGDQPLKPSQVDLDAVMERLYTRIGRLAGRIRAASNSELGATTLAHEAYLKLRSHPRDFGPKSYDEIIIVFANAMHQIVKDAGRRGRALKRTVVEPPDCSELPVEDVLTVLAGMEQLEFEDPRQAQIVRCRYMLGMTTEETSAALAVAPRTVQREFKSAQSRLSVFMGARSK